MRAVRKSVQLAGASALAIGAALFFGPVAAQACSATPTMTGGVVTAVTVTCQAGNTASPFATSFTSWLVDDQFISYDGNGADAVVMTGGTISSQSGFLPPFFVEDPSFRLDPSTGVIELLGGDDAFRMSGGTIGSATDVIGLSLGAGADLFDMSGGTISGSVFGLGGGNTYLMSGGVIGGSIFAGSQDDSVTISGTAIIQGTGADPDAVGLEDGDDIFAMGGGTVNGAVSGGSGDDVLTVGGGTITGFLAGNEGDDQITVSAGTVQGDVIAEEVTLTGGTIGGDILGITGNTLLIDDSASATPLQLSNGVTFGGTDAVGVIRNTNLANGGASTQNFTGFSSVGTESSTLAFAAGSTIGIGTLTLGSGSTLFAQGPLQLTGTLNVNGSTVTLIDGAADDIFTLGGLALNGATIGVDVDQQLARADQLVAGAFSAAGLNTVQVNLIGTPNFAGVTDIPVILAANGPLAGTFAVVGAPAGPESLFTFSLVPGADGGLLLRATPTNAGIATATNNAIDAASVETALDALDGINEDAAEFGLGLNRSKAALLTPTFGVFASGQFAEVDHDGFTVTSDNLVAAGPSFDASDFSAAMSLDFNVAKHLGFDEKYGLNIGVFGGYASTDVDLGPFAGLASVGNAENEAGMFGAYGLFRQGLNYALVSTTAFLGQTDTVNAVLGTTGSYDTEGFAVTASAGRIFALNDRVRFDLRGGVLGVTFEGGDYVDSGGNAFGATSISFGALKFEPGIYADYQLENGMVFSPYARADIQQRFAYENTSSIGGAEFEFDDADFSAALSAGFNVKMSQSATLSSEVRGKFSSDSTTLAGKIGLKIGF